MILSTETKTILKDFDRELENQDVEEEFIFKIKMDELMINDEDEATEEVQKMSKSQCYYSSDSCREKKEAKQSQITDFFKPTK